MRILNVCNLKGGVGKTITAVNLAYVFAYVHGLRVLVVDNDKQGNASRFFGVFGYERRCVGDLLTGAAAADEVVQATRYDRIDCVPANMTLLEANKAVLMDPLRPQQWRLKEALKPLQGRYDFCVIDNAPNEDMSVINALVAGDDVLVPVKVDRFTFDGVDELLRCIDVVRRNFNPLLRFCGCVITSFRRNEVNAQGAAFLAGAAGYRLLQTRIRWTDKVDESTFGALPVMVHSPRCGAARDYVALAREYLGMCDFDACG